MLICAVNSQQLDEVTMAFVQMHEEGADLGLSKLAKHTVELFRCLMHLSCISPADSSKLFQPNRYMESPWNREKYCFFFPTI